MQDKKNISVIICTFNRSRLLKKSLESLGNQSINVKEFEIIVVDNESYDGSLEILKKYENEKKIKLVIRRSSRGLGRNIAVKHSSGKYIISQIDMDDVFEPKLKELITIYHEYFEGFMLLVSGVPGVMIAPKRLIEEVGGYRDLSRLEDKDLYSRAAQQGRFKFLKSFKIVACSIKPTKPTQRLLSKIKNEYVNIRESFRIDYGLSHLLYILRLRLVSAENPVFIVGDLALTFWGLITHLFYKRYHNNFISDFSVDEFRVDVNKSNGA